MTIQMKATEQYFPVVLFIMLYKVVLAFDSVTEILNCDHSNESYRAVLYCGARQFSDFCMHESTSFLWQLLSCSKSWSNFLYKGSLNLFIQIKDIPTTHYKPLQASSNSVLSNTSP